MKAKTFVCDKCSKTFNREGRLSKHLEKCNQQQPQFKCNKCDQIFNRETRLTEHRKTHDAKKHQCVTCQKSFEKAWHLKRHKDRASIFTCDDHCTRRFCSRDEYEKHQRSIRPTADTTLTNCTEPTSIDLDVKLSPPTGFENEEGFLQQIHDNIDKIFDQVTKYKYVEKINKQISSDFTYRQLRDFLDDIYSQQTDAYKINVGFGYILYHSVKNEYKYYFNSTNNLLFENAFTISNSHDKSDHTIIYMVIISN